MNPMSDFVTSDQRVNCDDKHFLSDIFSSVGLNKMAKDVLRETSQSVIKGYIEACIRKAQEKKNHEAMERLYFMGYL